MVSTPADKITLARALFREKAYVDALPLFQQAISERSDIASWQAGLGACHIKMEQFEGAIGAYAAAIALIPDVSNYHAGLAAAHVGAGDFVLAEASYNTAITLEPEASKWHLGLGRTQIKAGNDDDAARSFREALDTGETRQGIRVAFARILVRLGEFDEALFQFQIVVDQNPNNHHIQAELSRLLFKMEKLGAALLAAKHAIALKPDSKQYQVWLDRIWGAAPSFTSDLASMDGNHPRDRFYIAGCGRSGTWMFDSMMACFEDTWHAREEHHFGHFARIDAPQSTHVLKRYSYSFQDIHTLPETIALLYIVRHPFDVLTSTHIDRTYYIPVDRWKEEVAAMQRVLGRPNSLFIKFEDLIRKPEMIQAIIQKKWKLTPQARFSDFDSLVNVTDHVNQAMNGVRKPDPSRIERYRQNAEHLEYCEAITPDIACELRWLSGQFGYSYSDTIRELLEESEQ